MSKAWGLLLGLLIGGCAHGGNACLCGGGSGETVTIAIVATTDIHGRMAPTEYRVHGANGHEGHTVEVGGVDLLAGYLEAARRRFGERLVFLDGGDVYQGTMLSNEFEGRPMARALSAIGLQASALGNHEFDFGDVGPFSKEAPNGDPFGALKALLAGAGYPTLSSNVLERSSSKAPLWPGLKRSVVIAAGEVRVAVVGGTTMATPGITPGAVGRALEFVPLAPALIEVGKEIVAAAGADVMVGLIHAGGSCSSSEERDGWEDCNRGEELTEVALALPAGLFDVLIGGHTHRGLMRRHGDMAVIQGGAYLGQLAIVEIDWSLTRRTIVGMRTKLVPLCPWQWADGRSCLEASSGRRESARFMGTEVKPVSILAGVLTGEESALMQRAADPTGSRVVEPLLRGNGRDNPEGMLVNAILMQLYPDAEVAVFNGSGIRARLEQGEITTEEVYSMLPFDNAPATVTLSGAKLVELLRVATSGAHDLPVVRGLRVHVDLGKDPCISIDRNGDGKREQWERDRLVSVTLENGGAIEPSRQYRVVTNSYVALGGSGLSRVLKDLPVGAVKVEEGFPLLRDLVEGWLRRNRVSLGEKTEVLTHHPEGPLMKVSGNESTIHKCNYSE